MKRFRFSINLEKMKIEYNIFKTKRRTMSIEAKPKIIFILGGPGAGKGTQCGIMTEKYGY